MKYRPDTGLNFYPAVTCSPNNLVGRAVNPIGSDHVM